MVKKQFMEEYRKWRSRVSIECAVNVLLWRCGHRPMVQIDATYHEDISSVLEMIDAMSLPRSTDARGNIPLSHSPSVRPGTLAYARQLDPDFYTCVFS